MKTFRLIGAALLAILMCANFASCSKDDDADTGGDDVVVGEKKLVEMVSNYDSYRSTTYTFSYDNEGRVSSAIVIYEDRENSEYLYKEEYRYEFIWSDDAVVVKEEGEEDCTSTYVIRNGLVQSYSLNYNRANYCNGTFSYNSSNRFLKTEYEVEGYRNYMTINASWDKDKLVSLQTRYGTGRPYYKLLTYGETTCKKGYFPLISVIFDLWGGDDVLFMAHPEIAGMHTNQLPNTYSYADDEEFSLTYEYDKEGYISKIKMKNKDGNTKTHTLTWK